MFSLRHPTGARSAKLSPLSQAPGSFCVEEWHAGPAGTSRRLARMRSAQLSPRSRAPGGPSG
eukprot:8326704-Pyramimonas_sp.AAC.1